MAWSAAARAAALQVRRMKVRFSAQQGRTKINRTFVVKAGDNYAAMDAVAKRIGKRYTELTNKVFRFKPVKTKMGARLARIIKSAGPEED